MAVTAIHLIPLLLLLSPSNPTPLKLSPDRIIVGPFNYTEPGLPAPTSKQAYPLHIVWRRPLPREESYAFRQPERSTPLIRDQQIILGTSHAPGLFIFERSTGALLARVPADGTVEARIVQYPGAEDLVFGDAGGYVTRMSVSGEVRWKHESIGPVVDPCLVADGKVWYRAVDDSLVTLDAETGDTLWTYKRGPRYLGGLEIFGAGVPALTDEGMLVAGFADGAVVGLNAADGNVRWERRIGKGDRWTDVDSDPVLLDGGKRVVAAAYTGPTVCLDTNTGEELWRAEGIGFRGSALVRNHALYFSTHSGTVVALDDRNGHRLWRFEIPEGAVASSPVLWRDHLVVTDSKGAIYILDPATGALRWQSRLDVRIMGFSGPLAVNEDMLVGVSDGGWVYAFAADDFTPEPVPTLRCAWREPWALTVDALPIVLRRLLTIADHAYPNPFLS